MRFIEIDGEHINAEAIHSYYFTKTGGMSITYINGVSRTFPAPNRRFWEDEMSGARHIVQVIPCEAPVWAVWREDDGSYYFER